MTYIWSYKRCMSSVNAISGCQEPRVKLKALGIPLTIKLRNRVALSSQGQLAPPPSITHTGYTIHIQSACTAIWSYNRLYNYSMPTSLASSASSGLVVRRGQVHYGLRCGESSAGEVLRHRARPGDVSHTARRALLAVARRKG